MEKAINKHTKWFIPALGLIGGILNIKHNVWGFGFWIVTNTYLTIYNVRRREYFQAVLFVIYLLSCVWGIYEWGK